MANPHKAEIQAEIGGHPRILRLAANELVELQHFLGKGPIALLQPGALDYREACAVIHFGLQGKGVKQDFKKTLALLDGTDIATLIDTAAKLLMAGLGVKPDADEKDAEGNASAPGANGSTTSPGAA